MSHNQRNLELLTQVLEQANYHTIATNNYSELATALADYKGIDLGLIDLAGCDRQIWEYCEQLQSENIPFLTFTPKYNPIIERDSLVHGASSIVIKPLVIQNLLLLIDSLVDNSG
ncbi:response regulator [Pleurocapsa sp. PCC 7319]|uniref:response regulator n=1 Tax=Pleurocapsa sp. PCC 7319 TaxID=118161 RepID=UPI001ED9A4FB|nr:response regulator [Pleurocapsa sp. PCC 7319]